MFISVFVCIQFCGPVAGESANNSPTRTTRAGEFDETPAREWLETTLELTFESAIQLTVFAEFKIHEVYLPIYEQMTADGIRKQYEIETKATPTNPPILLALYREIDELFEKLLNQTFPGSKRVIDNPKLNNTSIYNIIVDEDKYDPPVIITHYCSYLELLNSAYFNEDELAKYDIQSASDLLEGSLKVGATITQNIKLFANAGHKNRYIFNVPLLGTIPDQSQNQLIIAHPYLDEITPRNNYKVQFTNDNTYGNISFVKHIKGLELRARYPNKQTKENIRINFDFNMHDFDNININKSRVLINSVKLKNTLVKLPSNITDIEILSADGIRLFYENGIINLQELQTELDSELAKIRDEIMGVLNISTEIILGINWSMASVSGVVPMYHLTDTVSLKRMGSERPISGYLYSHNSLKPGYFESVSSLVIKGLLNAGAKGEVDLKIKTGYDYIINLTLPPGFRIENLPHLPSSIKSVYEYFIEPDKLEQLIFVSEKPTYYHSSEADVEVRIDFHEIEVLGFNEYKGSVKIDSVGILQHIKVDPDSRFSKALPEQITMDYYNSDALRLLYTEKLLNLSEIEDDMYLIIKENVSKMLDEDLKMRVDFDEEMLKFDGNVSRMDDVIPINFQIHASGKMRITEERLVRMGSFVTKQIELPLSGIRYWNVTYILILPQYIDILGSPWVEETSTDYFGPIVERNSDGRYVLEITIHGDSEEIEEFEIIVNLDIDLTIWFFLSKIVIPLVLSIVLLILIIVITFMRRYKAKKLKKMQEEEDLLVEEEEYHSRRGVRAIFSWREETLDKAPASYDEKRFRKQKVPETDEDYSERLRELAPGIGSEKKKRFRKSASPFKKKKSRKTRQEEDDYSERFRRY